MLTSSQVQDLDLLRSPTKTMMGSFDPSLLLADETIASLSSPTMSMMGPFAPRTGTAPAGMAVPGAISCISCLSGHSSHCQGLLMCTGMLGPIPLAYSHEDVGGIRDAHH